MNIDQELGLAFFLLIGLPFILIVVGACALVLWAFFRSIKGIKDIYKHLKGGK